ncbi:2-hydroxyacid dehydrogenase [Streptomyces sp. NA04227]|uniref:2-hydroxyacid dehydrogenase n=1 Tax=Streptomyces sp. NA04227 TaxID=2742136 RepID=UPI001590BC4D|nr:2-hydroxyacid dehydrogenase [Streptomyces sp. NA04227]QKW09368.1 2-hydroxyacid dehydrogenase [Streptomyces sp. NA04227]
MTSDVWLPFAADEIEGLPAEFAYRFWDGAEDFPADPADCVFYVVPYMKGPRVSVRPLAEMASARVVQTLTAGIDHVEPGLADMRDGVLLCNARGVHEASTSELVLTLTLASLRRIPDFVDAQRAGRWRTPAVFPQALADKSVLIVGYGSIGAAVEDRLAPFELARVARIARSRRNTERGPVHSLDDLPELLPEADVVILTTPLTKETRGLVDGAFLARMKEGALLVNVARGAVVNTDALLAELTSGRLRAALDVTDPEPLPDDHPLWHAPGVLISPHTGGPTSAFLPRATRLVAAQLQRFAKGEPLHNVVLTTGS